MIEKIRPLATIEHRWNCDGYKEWYEIDYECPNCRKHLKVGDIACDVCGIFFDWSKRARIVVERRIVWE